MDIMMTLRNLTMIEMLTLILFSLYLLACLYVAAVRYERRRYERELEESGDEISMRALKYTRGELPDRRKARQLRPPA